MADIETIALDTRYFAEAAAPGTPSTGQAVVYVKTDGKLYLKDDAGTETDLTSGGGASSLGDLSDVTVSGSETDGQVLTSDGAGGFAFEDAAGGGMSNPMTTSQDIIVGGASGTPGRLAVGSEGHVLTVSSGNVGWAASVGSFDPDEHMPWHIVILPTVTTPDATTGTWQRLSTSSIGQHPFVENTAGTSGDGQPVYLQNASPYSQNDAIAWDIPLAAGTWSAHLHVLKVSSSGIVTLQQDGSDMGTADMYAAVGTPTKVSITGWTVSTTGKKRINLKMATKNASSSAYRMLMVAMELQRTA